MYKKALGRNSLEWELMRNEFMNGYDGMKIRIG